MASGIMRFSAEIGDHFDWFYLQNLGRTKSLLIHSEGTNDDDFARAVLSEVEKYTAKRPRLPLKVPFDRSSCYGFDAILAVPPTYHGVFEGTLDDRRQGVILCVPIHHFEFSGVETEAEFRLIHFRINVWDWRRKAKPTCWVKFDNPKTGEGTIGKSFVLLDVPFVASAVKGLSGVKDGYLVARNYQQDSCEFRSSKRNEFVMTLPDEVRTGTTKEATALFVRFVEGK
jgi:hypothetical protein